MTDTSDKALGLLRQKLGGLTPGKHCQNCGCVILVTIFMGGDYCSDNCRKELGKDIK